MELLPGLPHDLSLLCLCRLPLKSLTRARCVNRAWMETLSSEHFLRMRRESQRCESVLLVWNSCLPISSAKSFLFDSDGNRLTPSAFGTQPFFRWFDSLFESLSPIHEPSPLCSPCKCSHQRARPDSPGHFVSTCQIWSPSFFHLLFPIRMLLFLCDASQMLRVICQELKSQRFLEIHDLNSNSLETQPLPDAPPEYHIHGCVFLRAQVHVFRSPMANPQADSGRVDVYDLASKRWTVVPRVQSPSFQCHRGMVTVANGTVFGILSTSSSPTCGRASLAKLDMAHWRWVPVVELPQLPEEDPRDIPFISECHLVSFGNKLFVFCRGGVSRRSGFCSSTFTSSNWFNVLDVSSDEVAWIKKHVPMETPVRYLLQLSL